MSYELNHVWNVFRLETRRIFDSGYEMTSQHLSHIWKILFSLQCVYPFRHSCFAEKAGFVPQTGYLSFSITMSYSHEPPHPLPNIACACISVCMLVVCVQESWSFFRLMFLLALAFTYFVSYVCPLSAGAAIICLQTVRLTWNQLFVTSVKPWSSVIPQSLSGQLREDAASDPWL